MKPRLALDNCHISIQCEERNYIMRLQQLALEAVHSYSTDDKIRNAWGSFSILHIHTYTVGLAVCVGEGVNLRSFVKKRHVSEKYSKSNVRIISHHHPSPCIAIAHTLFVTPLSFLQTSLIICSPQLSILLFFSFPYYLCLPFHLASIFLIRFNE
jgi:hypothetical protein